MMICPSKCRPLNSASTGGTNGCILSSSPDRDLFAPEPLEPLAPYLDRVAMMIFEFGTFSKVSYAEPGAFFDDLDGFLRRLPRSIHYCIEIRNDDYLQSRYFELLRSNGVAHTLSSWSRMPSLRKQLLIEDVFTAPHVVARALLRPGRAYDQAVKLFSPYREIKEVSFGAHCAARVNLSCPKGKENGLHSHQQPL
jgi:hypothetical protein